jgi:hypothetical protein
VVNLRDLAVGTAIGSVAMIFVPLAVEILVGLEPWHFWVDRGVMVVLPILTSVLMLADVVRQGRRHENEQLLSLVPVAAAVVGAVVMFMSVWYESEIPKEEGVAIGLGVPYGLVPFTLLAASLMHRSASRKLDATPDRD